MLYKIKYGFQRMFKGYSDDIKWDFEDYFYKFLKPLKEFCEEQIEKEYKSNNKRIEIFKKTLELIIDYNDLLKKLNKEEMELINSPDIYNLNNLYIKVEEKTKEFWTYFGKHINYYWD